VAARTALIAPRTDEAVARARASILVYGQGAASRQAEHANIRSTIGVAQYVAICREVASRVGQGSVLDWGAGWGRNSLLLTAHGLGVTAYDVADNGAGRGLLAGCGIRYVIHAGPGLPFDGEAFDAILNCGVLEHVDDEAGALAELRRVLRPGGLLFTYHLPNRHAYTEWLGRRLGGYYHHRTYTRQEAIRVQETAGFRVELCRPFHLLPRNVWGRLAATGRLGARTVRAYDALDAGLLRVPGLARVATAWALIAHRAD
jgi:2-polyprenyl-3-methyl-5-hydroxy-6-metoxy-1,4-benzoquinol methylase